MTSDDLLSQSRSAQVYLTWTQLYLPGTHPFVDHIGNLKMGLRCFEVTHLLDRKQNKYKSVHYFPRVFSWKEKPLSINNAEPGYHHSSDVRTYVCFHMSLGKHRATRWSGLTLKLRYGFTSRSDDESNAGSMINWYGIADHCPPPSPRVFGAFVYFGSRDSCPFSSGCWHPPRHVRRGFRKTLLADKARLRAKLVLW